MSGVCHSSSVNSNYITTLIHSLHFTTDDVQFFCHVPLEVIFSVFRAGSQLLFLESSYTTSRVINVIWCEDLKITRSIFICSFTWEGWSKCDVHIRRVLMYLTAKNIFCSNLSSSCKTIWIFINCT